MLYNKPIVIYKEDLKMNIGVVSGVRAYVYTILGTAISSCSYDDLGLDSDTDVLYKALTDSGYSVDGFHTGYAKPSWDGHQSHLQGEDIKGVSLQLKDKKPLTPNEVKKINLSIAGQRSIGSFIYQVKGNDKDKTNLFTESGGAVYGLHENMKIRFT